MATYAPLPFPRRPKTPSTAASIRYQAQLLHYRYEINTGLYVMSPGEKLAFNLVNLAFAALLFSAVFYFFLPLELVGFAQRAVGGVGELLLVGGGGAGAQERRMQGALLRGVLPGEAAAAAAATLREGGGGGGVGLNASMVALPGIF